MQACCYRKLLSGHHGSSVSAFQQDRINGNHQARSLRSAASPPLPETSIHPLELQGPKGRSVRPQGLKVGMWFLDQLGSLEACCNQPSGPKTHLGSTKAQENASGGTHAVKFALYLGRFSEPIRIAYRLHQLPLPRRCPEIDATSMGAHRHGQGWQVPPPGNVKRIFCLAYVASLQERGRYSIKPKLSI